MSDEEYTVARSSEILDKDVKTQILYLKAI